MCKLVRFGLWLGIVASISLARTADANARIVLDSVSLDFGPVDMTSFRELTLQIRDTSSADVQIDAINPTSGNASLDFKVMSPSVPAIVSAGGSTYLSVVIRFTPGSLGQRNALLLIQTTDGNVTVPLMGTGTTEVSSLAFTISRIDFGLLSPGLRLDTVVELYSLGRDSATIFGTSITNAFGDTTFVAEILYPSIESPFKVAPGDSIAVRVSINGNFPLGRKQAQLS